MSGARAARRPLLIARTLRPVSSSPHLAGSLTVADASTNTGSPALWW